MKKYRLQNNIKNSFSFGSPLSLEDFSSELDNQLNILREVDTNNINLKIREQLERVQNRNSIDRKQRGNSQICLPFIKPIQKYKKKKKQICILPLIENIANKIEARLQKIQKANQSYSGDLQKYKQILYQQPPTPKPQIILTPQYYPIPIPINYYNNYPSIPINYQNYSYPNNQIQNFNQKFSTSNLVQPDKTKQKIQNTDIDSLNKAEMENRKNKLRRKLRVCFMAVYFMFLFRTYAQIVRYVRFQKYLQIQDIITEEYEGLQSDLFHTLVNQDFFEKFKNFTKKSENKKAKQKPNSSDVYFIEIDDEEVQINVSAFQDFFSGFLSQIEEKMNNQQLKALMPIFVHFLRHGYAFNQILLLQQLQTINFYLPQRKLNIDPQLSKALIINFIFLKIIVGKLLCKKEVLNMLYKIYRRKPEQKKYTLLYGKKLTIALVLFYKAINNKFFTDFKHLTGNYTSLKSDSKVIPMDSIQYQFSLSQEQDQQNRQYQNQLIKKIRSPAHLEQEFISSFQQNWAKIQEIADKMYQETLLEKKQQIILLKQQILDQQFPSRSDIKIMDSMKRMKSRIKASSKLEIGKMTIGNNAFKSLATIKRIAARKTEVEIAGQRKPTIKQTQSKTNSIQRSQKSESKLVKKKKT